VRSLRFKRLLVAGVAGLLAAALAGGVAGAQTQDAPSSALVGVLRGGLGHLIVADEASAIAQLLGISVEQLEGELVGRSLADVAASHGRTADEVVTVVVDTADRRIDQAVAFWLVSPADGAELKAEVASMAPDLVQSPAASAMMLSELGW
jgi:hypothetical protein